MRSVLFFLVVFSTLLGVLYFFVEKDPFPRPPVEFGDDLERAQFESSANTVELPFYNTKKGRREYVLRGELDDALIQDIQDIRDLAVGSSTTVRSRFRSTRTWRRTCPSRRTRGQASFA